MHEHAEVMQIRESAQQLCEKLRLLHLEAKGWKIGTLKDFLELAPEEAIRYSH
jgi:hypothetical protein